MYISLNFEKLSLDKFNVGEYKEDRKELGFEFLSVIKASETCCKDEL